MQLSLNHMSHKQVKTAMFMMAFAVVALFAVQAVHAGAGGTEFDSVWTTLSGWMQGTLGKIAAGAMILVGIISGIARGSIMGFALGVGSGIGLYNSPTVLDAMLTASLEHAPAITHTVVNFANGLSL